MMIVRGFVEAIVDDTHVKVRVPKVNKMEGAVGATPTAELAIGVVCTPPGYSPRLRRGDAVIIGYENEDESSPIVLGMLFTLNNDTTANAKIDSLEVKVDTKLSENTAIGNVSKENIQFLQGLKDNAQSQLDSLSHTASTHQDAIDQLFDIADKQQKEDANLEAEIEQLRLSVATNSTNIRQNAADIKDLQAGTVKFASVAYGTASPESISNPVEGQVYLYIQ